MTIRETISHLKKSPLDAWYYIQGEARIICYRNPRLKWLIRDHIVDQFLWRMKQAALPCLMNGSCLCCECQTPDLFFAKKACSAGKLERCIEKGMKQCYPALMGRKKWIEYKKLHNIIVE